MHGGLVTVAQSARFCTSDVYAAIGGKGGDPHLAGAPRACLFVRKNAPGTAAAAERKDTAEGGGDVCACYAVAQ